MIKDATDINLSGKDFCYIDLSARLNDKLIYFRYFAPVQKGHSLTFAITHLAKGSLEKFEKVLAGLSFDPS